MRKGKRVLDSCKAFSLERYGMNPVYVKLVASDAKVQAAAIIDKLRRGENAEVGNWDVLAWVSEMLHWVINADLKQYVEFYRSDAERKTLYSPAEIDNCIKQDIDCRPPVLEPEEQTT